MSNMVKACKSDIETLAEKERAITDLHFTEQIQDYNAAASAPAKRYSILVNTENAVNTLAYSISQIEYQLRDVVRELKARIEGDSDPATIVNVKKGLKKLKVEIKEMNVSLGVRMGCYEICILK